MRILIIVLLVGLVFAGRAQRVFDLSVPADGQISLAPGIQIDRIAAGYTLWLPQSSPVNGLIVFFHPRRDTLQADSLIRYALGRQLGVMYVTTHNRLDFFFTPDDMQPVGRWIAGVVNRHEIPPNRLLYCGMSLAGTRALRLTMQQGGAAGSGLRPRAVAVCDAPLDMIRFHRAMDRAAALNYHPAAAGEGKWVKAWLEKNLHGTPADNPDAYRAYSPYCYQDGGLPAAAAFRDVAVRAYTEPDVQWWMKTRRKDFYGMNAIDMAGLVNELWISGNEEAELITTTDRGFFPDGTRHPHSWSIVDEYELVDWFMALPGR